MGFSKGSAPGLQGRLGMNNPTVPVWKLPQMNTAGGVPSPADLSSSQVQQAGLWARYRALMAGSRSASFITGQTAGSTLIGGGV